MRPSKKVVLLSLLLLAASLLAVGYIRIAPHERAADLAPDEVMGMPKVVVREGPEAIELARRSHIGELKDLLDLAIIHYFYGENRGIIAWVGLYPSEEVAAREVERMASAMVRIGGSWAENLERLNLEGKEVYRTSPDGRIYEYFWSSRRGSYYIVGAGLSNEEILEFVRAMLRRLER